MCQLQLTVHLPETAWQASLQLTCSDPADASCEAFTLRCLTSYLSTVRPIALAALTKVKRQVSCTARSAGPSQAGVSGFVSETRLLWPDHSRFPDTTVKCTLRNPLTATIS